ncbi:hypothetical protein DdX_18718 [Ditylenchus destructor]|uniref:Uncharacterized protein n=1 Tax=Ditylenchus destructor TaxID=166010 RepID=A0AAD4MLS1_9BILA|nr:hypothetical protein DdX_18718 [Ditylenchus destructor]
MKHLLLLIAISTSLLHSKVHGARGRRGEKTDAEIDRIFQTSMDTLIHLMERVGACATLPPPTLFDPESPGTITVSIDSESTDQVDINLRNSYQEFMNMKAVKKYLEQMEKGPHKQLAQTIVNGRWYGDVHLKVFSLASDFNDKKRSRDGRETGWGIDYNRFPEAVKKDTGYLHRNEEKATIYHKKYLDFVKKEGEIQHLNWNLKDLKPDGVAFDVRYDQSYWLDHLNVAMSPKDDLPDEKVQKLVEYGLTEGDFKKKEGLLAKKFQLGEHLMDLAASIATLDEGIQIFWVTGAEKFDLPVGVHRILKVNFDGAAEKLKKAFKPIDVTNRFAIPLKVSYDTYVNKAQEWEDNFPREMTKEHFALKWTYGIVRNAKDQIEKLDKKFELKAAETDANKYVEAFHKMEVDVNGVVSPIEKVEKVGLHNWRRTLAVDEMNEFRYSLRQLVVRFGALTSKLAELEDLVGIY